jgi:hypothetical protein
VTAEHHQTQPMAAAPSRVPSRLPVSIICVFNDPKVRERCLDRSIEDQRHEAPQVEYLPIDNVSHAFATAAAALNHGASLATHDFLVFVHQDVYLHSLAALEEAAAVLAERPDIGLLGALGITAEGRIVGQIRDRVVLLGDEAVEPVEVDSLDEVLFIIPRRLWETEPLVDVPELAWHAYAVEYGLRVRALGLRTAAIQIPLTHNSLTINLDRLDVAHAAVAQRYPAALPTRTTCGTITESTPKPRPSGFLTAHRWRYWWLRESLVAHAARRAVGGNVVLSDIRRDIDDLMALVPDGRLTVANLVNEAPTDGPHPVVRLQRRDLDVTMSSSGRDQLVQAVADRSAGETLLLTNLSVARLRELAAVLTETPRVTGFHGGIGCWVLLGPGAAVVPPAWRTARATPLGLRRLGS